MSATFVRQQLIAPRRRRARRVGTLAWLRQRLFGGVLNSIATLVSALILAALVWPTVQIPVHRCGLERIEPRRLPGGDGRPPVGACWPFITAKFAQFMYGFYPRASRSGGST